MIVSGGLAQPAVGKTELPDAETGVAVSLKTPRPACAQLLDQEGSLR
jgi:hypothetical protein